MTKTESAEHLIKTLVIESCEQLLEFHAGAGVRLAIPNTKNLIMVGTQEWIAKNVPGVEAMVEGAPVVTPWEDRESLYENTLFSQVERMEAEIAELRTRLAATTQASTAQAERANANLHGAIMNLPCNPPDGWGGIQQTGYKIGHRDARHAAAELVNAQEDVASSTDAQAAAEVRDAALVEPERDPLYEKAVQIVRAHHRVSVSLVQGHLFIGYNRAARLIEAMEADDIVSACDGRGHRTLIERAGDTGEQADGGEDRADEDWFFSPNDD